MKPIRFIPDGVKFLGIEKQKLHKERKKNMQFSKTLLLAMGLTQFLLQPRLNKQYVFLTSLEKMAMFMR
jgi:hypothetical protein